MAGRAQEGSSRRDFLRGAWRRPAPSPPDPSAPLFATLQTDACLAFQGVLCDLCATACPVAGALRLRRGRPAVDPSRCTGCGDCIPACPAPRTAISVRPGPG